MVSENQDVISPAHHFLLQESWGLFTTLYHSWCHNPVATVALCLLSQNYEHASDLVDKFSNVEITAGKTTVSSVSS